LHQLISFFIFINPTISGKIIPSFRGTILYGSSLIK
jgi:hypothetical protein